MPDRLICAYDAFIKIFPWLVGLAVNFISFGDAVLRIMVTCVSMLSGALVVHYFKPIIVKRVTRLKKN